MTFSTLVEGGEGLVEFSLNKFGAESCLHEGLSLFTRKVSVRIHIEFRHDPLGNFLGRTASESIMLSEIGVRVEKHLDVVVEVLPNYLSLVSQIFAIDSQKLRHGILHLRVAISTLIDNFDFSASHVSVMTFEGLGSTVLLCISEHACHTNQVIYSRVTDPSHVHQTIIHAGEWIDNHSTTRVFAIADHHQCSLEV